MIVQSLHTLPIRSNFIILKSRRSAPKDTELTFLSTQDMLVQIHFSLSYCHHVGMNFEFEIGDCICCVPCYGLY